MIPHPHPRPQTIIVLYSSLIGVVLILGFPLTIALDLSQRNLVDIPPDISPEGTTLDLSGNMLTIIKAGAFSRLTNLTELRLVKNLIHTVEPGAFDGLLRLEFLHLGENKLEFIPDFSLLPMIKFLTLGLNPLHSMDLKNEENLREAVYLEELNIQWTWRNYFPPFPYLQNMKRLSLVGNHMRNTPLLLFQRMPNLEKIWMNYNKLSSIPISQDFTGNITSLWFAHNRIYHIPDLSSFPSLRQIDLSYNYIYAVPGASLSTIISGTLVLEGNPVLCARELCWLKIGSTTMTVKATCSNGRSWTELNQEVICEGL